MFKINDNYQKLPGSYLFSTIAKKVNAYSAANPEKQIIRLGIGDVTQPIAPAIIDAMHKAVDEMGHAETFHGYAPFLYLTEQRVIPETFRRFLRRIIRSLSVILSIRFMWIPTLWLEGPALMMQIHRCGVT